ncbi:MAG: OmpA family protein [Acidobacteria bacterium]|nr:OmpA family protein [Acidobacteriota bacterium]MBV9476399.1 OmpA family protein [Acidobacteriota bacterium]
MKQFIASILIALLAGTTAFADVATERDKTKKGAVIGGVAGAIAGAIIGNNRGHHSAKRGATVGVLAGTAAGAIVGAMMDKQERELRQIEGINVQRTDEDELKVTVRNEILFDYDSAALRSSSRSELREMADVFNKYGDTTIVVAGHTDSTGSSAYNQRLSERRANSVASYLEGVGVRGSRLDAVGYGEAKPKESNSTASGRQANRRVELYVRANS